MGSLIYIMSGTRPDLCYIVTKLSQNMGRPIEANLIAEKHVLQYLKGTTEQSLKFRKGADTLKLLGFCDSDWAGDVFDMSGYDFLLLKEGPLVSWRCRKQATVALSTCEAEYIALARSKFLKVSARSKFLKKLYVDLKVAQVSYKVVENVGNQGAINLAKNPR